MFTHIKPRQGKKKKKKQSNRVNIRAMYIPLGETITGCDNRCSRCKIRAITMTDPRLVPTHKHGDVSLSETKQKYLSASDSF